MFGVGFFATVASIIAGGAVATVTVVGIVNHNVETSPDNPGNVRQSSQIAYGNS